jgi:hypothetical protein
MNKIIGYVRIKKDPKTFRGIGNVEKYSGKTVRVLEFGMDGCALVVNSEASELASFDKEDIEAQFTCDEFQNVLTPPDLNMQEQMIYADKVYKRKGGYNDLLRNMTIVASLATGKFTDTFLWQNQ